MGGRIYRIWSTDWFADPDREMAKLLSRLDLKRAEFAEKYAAAHRRRQQFATLMLIRKRSARQRLPHR